MNMEELISAALEKDWDRVDQEMPEVVQLPEAVNWAYDVGIYADNGDVRDLGVSIIELSVILPEKFEEKRERLFDMMQNDKNSYVQYRCAFAFVQHGVGDYQTEVEATLNRALKDKEVSAQAQRYLDALYHS